jgi:sulfur-oxidizing protein SoxA
MIRGTACLVALLAGVGSASADPESERQALARYFEQRFPDIEIAGHIDGAYALNEQTREQWLAMEDFPPYEFSVDDGEVLFGASFKDGSGYQDCFDDGNVKAHFPYFDHEKQTVVTLELAINDCRVASGEEPLAYNGEDIALLSAYMAFASRDSVIDIEVPPAGLAAYEAGKQYYYSRRGQLNFSCSQCHMLMSGMKLRAETLSAAIGQVTHWPVYRFKWQEIGPLHRRFVECNEQVGAEGLAYQSETYRNLEYFLTYMSQGLPLNGPASRK